MCDGLRPGETLGGLRAVIDSQGRDIVVLRTEIEGLKRELATYRPVPDLTPAPRFEGYAWLGSYAWTGPYHLVPITVQPYPSTIAGVHLPDITVPAKKGICGEAWSSMGNGWPAANEACPRCVQKAHEMGLRAALVTP